MAKLRSVLTLVSLLSILGSFAQLPQGFNMEKIDRTVRTFPLDTINLSSPLDYYLSRARVCLSGKASGWNEISTSMFCFDNEPDIDVDDTKREYILNENIDFIVSYGDSVASIVTHNEGERYVLFNNCWLESGQWVNRGQGLAENFEEALAMLKESLPQALFDLPRIDIINNIPEDACPFAEYLSGVRQTPEEFLLDMLGSHRLVINGEYHRRKVSWDMLKRLIAMPEFAERVGCVFMEMPSWHQSTMDRFMTSDTLDSSLIIKIFQDVQINGWWDRGEYEFLCELWALNQSLDEDKRVRVVLADYQVPYSAIKTNEEACTLEDRNMHMAGVIAKTIKQSDDPRNFLFLVGCGHAAKSRLPGYASSADGKAAALTAGAQLAETLGNENVFTVFQHALPGDNSGRNKAPIRGGIFDKAFELDGNRPVGFRLAGSPFGAEPFDGIYELKYKTSAGRYQDNFDGYLFLSPLATEPQAKPLTEIFTDEFVAEMQRRAKVLGYEDFRSIWFGRRALELTKDYIINHLSGE